MSLDEGPHLTEWFDSTIRASFFYTHNERIMKFERFKYRGIRLKSKC